MATFDDKFLEETISISLGDPEFYHVPMGVSRYDYSDQHGWWVRIRRDNTPFQKFFYDSHYSTIGESLRAAIQYRHEIISSFPLERKRQGIPRSLPLEPENRIARRVTKGKNQPYIFWQAVWYDENHKKQLKRFSVNKYGEEEARKLALELATKSHNTNPKPIKELDIVDPYEKQVFSKESRIEVDEAAKINSERYKNDASGDASDIKVEESFPFGYEGGKTLKLHLSVERDRKLRDAKVRSFLKENGEIFCEVCSFNFSEAYPFLKKNIIEVHHIVPLSQLSAQTVITLSDLILLCANCHLAVHQGDEEENLILAMDHFEEER